MIRSCGERAHRDRAKSSGLKLYVECKVGEKVEGGVKFTTRAGSKCCEGQAPVFKRGTSALHPSFLEYGLGSGELEAEGSAETVTGKIEGEVKIPGYDEQELINAKF